MFTCCICGTEERALEENLKTSFSKIQANNDPTAKDQSLTVNKLSVEARVPMKGSARAAGDDLYTIAGTGIAIGLPHNTYAELHHEVV